MVEWLSVNQSSGSGITIISVTASANTLPTSRTTSIVVSGLTTSVVVPITQEYIQNTLSVNPNTFSFQATGGTAYFDVFSPYDWFSSGVTSDCSISPVSGSSGTTTVTLSVPENTVYEKQFSFDIYNEHQSETVHISQDAASSSGSVTDYLTFEIVSGGEIHWKKGRLFTANTGIIQYSINNGPWQSYTPQTGGTGYVCNVSAGDIIRFKGDNSCYSQSPGYDYTYAATFSGTTATFNISGNINSLIDSTNFSGITTLSTSYTYQFLFHCCNVINAYNLVLPNTSLTECCYDHLFGNCTALKVPPRLISESVATSSYGSMFYNCQSLESVQSSLPASSLDWYCYDAMFARCVSLTKAPSLPSTVATPYCYRGMFYGCTSLVTAPSLPATGLSSFCYEFMFRDCTSLTNAPELPANNIVNDCYRQMFQGCTSLEIAPVLPAIDLQDRCYYGMFSGCTALWKITCLTNNPNLGTDATTNWTTNVASSGLFIKSSGLVSGWVTGKNGIPSGWSVRDAT